MEKILRLSFRRLFYNESVPRKWDRNKMKTLMIDDNLRMEESICYIQSQQIAVY